MLAWNGCLGISKFNGITSPAYGIYRILDNNNPRYFGYLFSTDIYKNIFRRHSHGVIESRLRLYSDKFFSIFTAIPPISIQNKIAEYIDTKTAAIEKIISARQKLFEIFQEHTETLLFTGGVDENAKKKKSDIFWLPEIPKNWKTEKAKHLFGEICIKNFPNETILSATQDKGVIPRSDIEDGVVMPAGDRSNYKLVDVGEFVISLRSFQGGIEYSGYRGLVSPAYTVLRAKQEIGTSFYKYLFKTSYFIGALNTIITGIRDGKNINYSDFAELILPDPPLDEQIRIGKMLDNKQQLIAHYQKEISLLQEYRTRLISDAVFGKFINKL
jgi:type I restriction enzyme S subunit